MVPALPDDAVADLAADGPGGPLEAAAAFCYAVSRLNDEAREVLAQLVTPVSAGSWGDFSEAREMLAGLVMLSKPHIAAPGIAHARFTDDPGSYAYVPEGTEVPVQVFMTLTWDPDRFPQWRVHALGGYVPPQAVPCGTAPA
jgi:hypothetical protein